MKQRWFSKSGLPRIDLSKLRSRHSHAPSGEQSNEGIEKLYGEVQSCGYEDVHVMWQLLHHQSSAEVTASQQEVEQQEEEQDSKSR